MSVNVTIYLIHVNLGNHRALALKRLFEEGKKAGADPQSNLLRFGLIAANVFYIPDLLPVSTAKVLWYANVDNKNFQVETNMLDQLPLMRRRRDRVCVFLYIRLDYIIQIQHQLMVIIGSQANGRNGQPDSEGLHLRTVEAACDWRDICG